MDNLEEKNLGGTSIELLKARAKLAQLEYNEALKKRAALQDEKMFDVLTWEEVEEIVLNQNNKNWEKNLAVFPMDYTLGKRGSIYNRAYKTKIRIDEGIESLQVGNYWSEDRLKRGSDMKVLKDRASYEDFNENYWDYCVAPRDSY